MSDVALPGSIEPAAKRGPNLDGGINPLQGIIYLGVIAADAPPYLLDECRQGGLGICRDGEIDIGEALEILEVRLHVEVAGAETDGLGAGLEDWPRGALQLVAIGID